MAETLRTLWKRVRHYVTFLDTRSKVELVEDVYKSLKERFGGPQKFWLLADVETEDEVRLTDGEVRTLVGSALMAKAVGTQTAIDLPGPGTRLLVPPDPE